MISVSSQLDASRSKHVRGLALKTDKYPNLTIAAAPGLFLSGF